MRTLNSIGLIVVTKKDWPTVRQRLLANGYTIGDRNTLWCGATCVGAWDDGKLYLDERVRLHLPRPLGVRNDHGYDLGGEA